MTDTTTDPNVRAAYSAGLRALAEFLDTHPGLPVPRYSFSTGLTVYVSGSDADQRAEVDRIAGILGTAAREFGPGLYMAERQFCSPVAYQVFAVPESATDASGGTGEG